MADKARSWRTSSSHLPMSERCLNVSIEHLATASEAVVEPVLLAEGVVLLLSMLR